ncbi:putative arca-like protein [Rosellinia necatrix]|uniref:Putative arca-like protein n=1 Tax=Rosellinia necatrix TaxID=77044 RepID=A0A1S7UJ39_ROSNE|nr:putative arca-like protein [Rosellinia necatrix]
MRELCGLGISNQWTPPAMFTACIGIAMFGDRFSDQGDQEALAELLRKTESAHARPTTAIRQQLMKAWGWTDPDD